MKYSLAAFIAISLGLSSLALTSPGQTTGQRANEEAHKLTEKIKKKVAALGVGEIVNVITHDGKRLNGRITKIEETSFVVEDRQDKTQTSTLRYEDISSVSRWTHASSLTKGIVIGVAAAVAVIALVFFHEYCKNEQC